jgi:predicted transcriptional regulator
MKVSELMQAPVHSIRFDATLQDFDQLLLEQNISGAPVLAADGELLGLVSKTDVVRSYNEDPLIFQRGLKIWEIMTTEVLVVPSEQDVRETARKMREARLHRVLVCDGGELLGVVSSFDFLSVVADDLA